jgi:hypothetical protein
MMVDSASNLKPLRSSTKPRPPGLSSVSSNVTRQPRYASGMAAKTAADDDGMSLAARQRVAHGPSKVVTIGGRTRSEAV